MAYLGRKGAVAGLTSSDIPDNSITSAKIVDGAVAVADNGNDAVGTAELANDVVISTSGAITTTGGMTVDGATVFNEASADVDFRIEGNGDANLFYADAGNDRVGVGIANPACKLEVVDSNETVAKIKQSDNAGGMNMYLALENDGGGDLYISMLQNAAQGYIKYTDDNDICFQTNGMNTRMIIDSSGNVGIGETDPGTALDVVGHIRCSTNLTTVSTYGANISGDTYRDLWIRNDGLLGTSSSSERYKKNIKDMGSVDWLYDLRLVEFDWKELNLAGKTAHDFGLIAEEVHALGLTEFVEYNDDDEPDALHYCNMVSLLTKAIQEQQTLIETLTAIIETLEGGE